MVFNIAVVHVQRYKRNPKEANFFIRLKDPIQIMFGAGAKY